jgi:hypothetical protein
MDLIKAVGWFMAHKGDIALALTSIISGASILVRLTPTLKDDTWLLAVIKFISKFIALNPTVDHDTVRQQGKSDPVK